MKTMILALAAVATLGMAVPASAQGGQGGAPRGTAIDKATTQSQDFSSRHRRWHRHHRHCTTFWRHGRRITVCR